MTTVDLIIIAILLVSGMLAMLRGFTLELLSIMAFVAAALIALFALPVLKPVIGEALPQGLTGSLILVGVTFFIALIPLWYVSDRMAKHVRGSAVGAIDRTFGFAFGAVRGLFILAIVYLFVTGFGSKRSVPDWMQEAQLLPLVERTAGLIMALVPSDSGLGRLDMQAAVAPQRGTASRAAG